MYGVKWIMLFVSRAFDVQSKKKDIGGLVQSLNFCQSYIRQRDTYTAYTTSPLEVW